MIKYISNKTQGECYDNKTSNQRKLYWISQNKLSRMFWKWNADNGKRFGSFDYIKKEREYTKQFCTSTSKDVMQVKTNKKFKDQLKDIEYKICKNHIDLGEN